MVMSVGPTAFGKSVYRHFIANKKKYKGKKH